MKKILIIDDDEIFQFVMRTNLKKIQNEIEIKSFTNGNSFFEELFSTSPNLIDFCPDIIFVDVNMPLMNGWDIIEKISSSNCFNLKNIKLFVCSSSIDSRDIEKAKSYNIVSDYLVKPIEFEFLEKLVK